MEAISSIDRILEEDPSGDYRRIDFESRDMYRHLIELVGRRSVRPGEDTAEGVLELVQDHGQELPPPVGGEQFAGGVPARLRGPPPADGLTGRGRDR